LYDQIHADPRSSPRIASERAKSYLSLSRVERRLGNFPAASTAADAAVASLKSVVTYHPGVAECLVALADAYINLALTYRQARRLSDAAGAYRAAIDRYEEAILLAPGVEIYQRSRARAQQDLARTEKTITEARSNAAHAGS
jgi:tetratricopeptide (TPR) repeat protein